MSEFEEELEIIAQKEVEQVCFAYEDAGDTGSKKDWKKYYDLEKNLIEKVKKANRLNLTIPKHIADELKEAIGATNFENTPYSIKLDEDGYLKMWTSLRHKKLSENAYKFCRDNTRVFDAYLNPLTRKFVEVE